MAMLPPVSGFAERSAQLRLGRLVVGIVTAQSERVECRDPVAAGGSGRRFTDVKESGLPAVEAVLGVEKSLQDLASFIGHTRAASRKICDDRQSTIVKKGV